MLACRSCGIQAVPAAQHEQHVQHAAQHLCCDPAQLCRCQTLVMHLAPRAEPLQPCLCAAAMEIRDYLPANMSSVSLQPLGTDGVLVAGSDRQRGFGPLDQVHLRTELSWLAAGSRLLLTGLGHESIMRWCGSHSCAPAAGAAHCFLSMQQLNVLRADKLAVCAGMAGIPRTED